MDVTTDSGGDLYWLLRIPGDGDCLFGSIANQLYGVNPNDESFKPHSLYLRDVAVTDIQLHPDVYYEDLEAMACELIEGSAAPVQKVLAYIERLRSPGYWGGAECISALANFLNVVIVVYQHTSKIEFRPLASERVDLPCCQIYYRNINDTGEQEIERNGSDQHGTGNNNHYDSVLRIIPNDSTALFALRNGEMQRSQATRSGRPEPSELQRSLASNLSDPKTVHPYATGRKRFTSDPLLLATKVARQEFTASQETVQPVITISAKAGIRFASLNVNGCRTIGKREAIDSYLLQRGVHLAVLQEANLDSAEILTAHYRWYLGGAERSRKRGLAILVRHGVDLTIRRKGHSSSNIQYMDVSYQVIITN